MSGSYRATLTFWPATPLHPNAVSALRDLGIDIQRLHHDDHSVALSRTRDGDLVAQIAFMGLAHGAAELEKVFTYLAVSGANYVAWVRRDDEILGVARTHDSRDADDQEFYVLHGERLLTVAELAAFEHIPTAQGVLSALREWLTLPLPQHTEPLGARETRITITAEVPGTKGSGPVHSSRMRGHRRQRGLKE